MPIASLRPSALILQASCHSSVMSAFETFDTGQPALAPSAAFMPPRQLMQPISS
jgi:hypothetical protein